MDYVIKIGKNYIGVDGSGRYTEVTKFSPEQQPKVLY